MSSDQAFATCVALADRWRAYATAVIPDTIYSGDDMLTPGSSLQFYFWVGQSAMKAIFSALLLAEAPAPRSILDLPSGAGRVTRHLRAAFPDAELFVSGIIKDREEFAARTFDAKRLQFDPDFEKPAVRRFDLIFCGSLLTHLSEDHWRRAYNFLVEALEPGGVLVLTLHGRRNLAQSRLRGLTDEEWRKIATDCIDQGFRFLELENLGGKPYGDTRVSPSWMMRLLECDPRVRCLALYEAGWADNQDVIALHKVNLGYL